MTRLTNDPADFPAEALKGFIAANKRYVKPVYGGVARSTLTPAGKVAVVYGGGSGHYPAFAGWVGHGFADGAVCGNIFSSPSAAQAYSVLKAVHRGAGVLMGFGNYAGDVLHFGQAIERLRAEGIEADTLVVTDDIASGDAAEPEKRRGIAGDFPVFKITSAAAEAGLGFDEVRRVFARANAATRSFGVAFAGCTLPGAKGPLFTVPAGRMGIGLGIHGEPGVAEADLGSADDVARTLVEGLLADRPAGPGNRVVAIVNGLGSSKYEELFVVTSCVVALLEAAGLECADVEAGEFVTSLDMAGVSLTLVWVDDELLGYWDAPCDAPAYRKGSVGSVERDDAALSQAAAPVEVTTPGSTASRDAAEVAFRLRPVAGLAASRAPGVSAPLAGAVAAVEEGDGQEREDASDQRDVRDVSDEPVGVADEVHDVSAPDARLPDEPIGEVARRAAPDDAEGYRPGSRPATRDDERQGEDDRAGDGREHPGGPGSEGERRAGVEVEGEREEPAQHAHRPPVPQIVERPLLARLVDGERHEGAGERSDDRPATPPCPGLLCRHCVLPDDGRRQPAAAAAARSLLSAARR